MTRREGIEGNVAGSLYPPKVGAEQAGWGLVPEWERGALAFLCKLLWYVGSQEKKGEKRHFSLIPTQEGQDEP
jgi:hypothetical protein